MSILFESFMIFYFIEVFVLISVFIWYYKEPKKQKTKIHDPWGIWKDIGKPNDRRNKGRQ
jgi:hypothetical protein